MQLYNADSSPFATRVRIQIYHKRLDVGITSPPGGLGSDDFRAQVPLGRIPALAVNGHVISESLAIMEYLEDRFPEPAMRPAVAEDRARMRTLALAHDCYVQPELRRLFFLFREGKGDSQAVASAAADLKKALGQLSAAMGAGAFAAGDTPTIADCAMAPSFSFVMALPGLLEIDPLVAGQPRLSAWWGQVCKLPAFTRALGEMETAFRAYTSAPQG